MSINFYELIGPGGLDGARAEFERLIVQLAYMKHRAMGVVARPGDWGIDAFAGDLDGVIAVWQAKFFIDGVGNTQQSEIRASFKSALAAAKKHGHDVDTWTLCIPVDMEPGAAKWWTGWKKRQETATGVTIDLWAYTHLEAMLLLDETRHIAQHFFPKSMGVAPAPPPAKVHAVPKGISYDEALFIKQLHEAGIHETGSAKRQFFNHEVLAREVADKADPVEVQTLQTVEAEVHAIWEARFSGSPSDHDGQMPGLHSDVMKGIEQRHNASPPLLPPMSVVHEMGCMHNVVENGDAGWVRHFREVAERHRG